MSVVFRFFFYDFNSSIMFEIEGIVSSYGLSVQWAQIDLSLAF